MRTIPSRMSFVYSFTYIYCRILDCQEWVVSKNVVHVQRPHRVVDDGNSINSNDCCSCPRRVVKDDNVPGNKGSCLALGFDPLQNSFLLPSHYFSRMFQRAENRAAAILMYRFRINILPTTTSGPKTSNFALARGNSILSIPYDIRRIPSVVLFLFHHPKFLLRYIKPVIFAPCLSVCVLEI